MKVNVRVFIRVAALLLVAASYFGATSIAVADEGDRSNVLFIAIDDLRPELGCYGQDHIKSPHIDRLAAEGMTFMRAYCQAALCSPSRASVLSGLRPDSIGIYDDDPRRSVPNQAEAMTKILTLPEHFKNNGYNTLSVGKVFHAEVTDADAWTEVRKAGASQWRDPKNRQWVKKRKAEAKRKSLTGWKLNKHTTGPVLERYNAPDHEYTDGRVAQAGVKFMTDYHDKGPFFLAVGFVKPHLPLVAPAKYWDMYDESSIIVPSRKHPTGMPEYSLVPSWYETRKYKGIPARGDLSDELTREMIHAYYACVSFSDAMVGKLLAGVKALELERNTIVILWGDHGWKLGDYGDWSKYTNMEEDARVPLVLKVPGKTVGQVSDGLVELVDMYPTLAELCGLSIPEHVEGLSFVPLLDEPSRPWKSAGITQHYRGPHAEHMGYSLRHGKWRYGHWRETQTRKIVARELYDLSEPGPAKANLANESEYSDLIRDWDEGLLQGHKAFLPLTVESR